MALQELQNQALLLPLGDRWHLVQALLEFLKQGVHSVTERGSISRLRVIAQSPAKSAGIDLHEDDTSYLTKKYR